MTDGTVIRETQIPMPDGVRLRAKAPFPATSIDAVFGSVQYRGRPRTLEELDQGIRRKVAERHHRAARR